MDGKVLKVMTASRSTPKLVLGTNAFGSRIDEESTKNVVKRFINYHNNINEKTIYIDTAIAYGDGKSEHTLSQYTNNPNILISTKVSPSRFGGLTKESIYLQCNLSLQRLHTKCVDILYIHDPSNKTPILHTLFAINELYKENKFKRFGICHYAAWQVTQIIYLCNKYNLIKPSIYQGIYNILRREIEFELIPCLRHFNISFYAFSPNAKGIMAGNHKFEDLENNQIKKGVFDSKWSGFHHYSFWYKSFFDARDMIKNKCLKQNLSLLQANYSWLLYHSILDGSRGDRIILGGSKYQHFDENLTAIYKAKPLNQEMVKIFEKAWNLAKQEYLPYHMNIEKTVDIAMHHMKQSKI